MAEPTGDLANGTRAPLARAEIDRRLPTLRGWAVVDGKLRRDFKFADHYATMAFVNAIAWVSHRQDHHPDLAVGYDTCRVEYLSHDVGGLSEADFICAARIDALFGL
jgi:4a-hydroxytetrahydrobiopterin dehydratase